MMMVTTSLVTTLLARAWPATHAHLAVATLQVSEPAAWGLLLGIGYSIGELPNSFLKRQLDIAPGTLASGARGVFFWLVDQLDSVAGVVCALSLAWRPDALLIACLVGLALLLHPLVAALMLVLGLKERIG